MCSNLSKLNVPEDARNLGSAVDSVRVREAAEPLQARMADAHMAGGLTFEPATPLS